MKKTIVKKSFAWLLALVMIIGFMPAYAFAADGNSDGIGDNVKFQVKVSSVASDNVRRAALGTVDKDFKATLVIDNGLVNSNNFRVEAWMQDVSSLGVDGVRYHSLTIDGDAGQALSQMLGKNGNDSSLETIQGLLNKFEGKKVNANCDGNPVTYTLKKEETDDKWMMTATPDSTEAARTAWHGMVNDNNFDCGTNEDDDSYFLIANGSTLQIGSDLLEFEGDGDLVLDDFATTDLNSKIREHVQLSPTGRVLNENEIEAFLAAGTELAVGQSYAKLKNDVTIRISGLTIPEDTLSKLREGDYSGVVSTLLSSLNADEINVDIDFADTYDYKFLMKVSSTARDGITRAAIGRVDENYIASLEIDNGKVNANNVTFDVWMKNVASLGVGDERHHSLTIDGEAGDQLSRMLGKNGADSDLKTIQTLLDKFNGLVINADCDGEEVSYKFEKEDTDNDAWIMTATPSSTDEARQAWHNIVNDNNFDYDTKAADDSYIVVAYGSTLQMGNELLVFEKPADLLLDSFTNGEALNNIIRDSVRLVTDANDIDSDISFTLRAGTTLAVSNSYATLKKDVTVTISGITVPNDTLTRMRESDFSGAVQAVLNTLNSENKTIDVKIDFLDKNEIPAFAMKGYDVMVAEGNSSEPLVPEFTKIDTINGKTKEIVGPRNVTEQNIIKWVSDDESIATVIDGVVTGVKKGETTIKAFRPGVYDKEEIIAEFSVTVTGETPLGGDTPGGNGGTGIDEPDVPLTEPEHEPYMKGKAEGIFDPMGNFTRAEAATVLSRLTDGFSEDGNYSGADFSDVKSGDWFYKYVSFAQEKNLVNGYKDGTYQPNKPITRQEFAVLLARFLNIEPVEPGSEFTDMDKAGDWAKGYVAAMKTNGIIEGYEDGSFRPTNNITRAEAATMLNRVLDRVPLEKLDLAGHDYSNPFTDVSEGDWYFVQVMEATLEHVIEYFHE